MQDEYPVEAEYLRRVTEYYYGEARNLDFMFSPDESRITINDWVEEKTNNKINDLFPEGSIGPDVRLVLTNAVYFKGNWVHPFKLEKTESRPFYVTPETQYRLTLCTSATNASTIPLLTASKYLSSRTKTAPFP